jgi:hypothetical protein
MCDKKNKRSFHLRPYEVLYTSSHFSCRALETSPSILIDVHGLRNLPKEIKKFGGGVKLMWFHPESHFPVPPTTRFISELLIAMVGWRAITRYPKNMGYLV